MVDLRAALHPRSDRAGPRAPRPASTCPSRCARSTSTASPWIDRADRSPVSARWAHGVRREYSWPDSAQAGTADRPCAACRRDGCDASPAPIAAVPASAAPALPVPAPAPRVRVRARSRDRRPRSRPGGVSRVRLRCDRRSPSSGSSATQPVATHRIDHRGRLVGDQQLRATRRARPRRPAAGARRPRASMSRGWRTTANPTRSRSDATSTSWRFGQAPHDVVAHADAEHLQLGSLEHDRGTTRFPETGRARPYDFAGGRRAAREHACEGRLARPVGPDDRDQLARRDVERYLVQCVGGRARVAVADVAAARPAPASAWPSGIRSRVRRARRPPRDRCRRHHWRTQPEFFATWAQ